MITTNSPAQARQEQQKKGFTLTEIAIVLGIMGLVLGAIWVAAASVYTNQRINQANTAVMQVLQGVRTLYAQQAAIPAGNGTANMVNAGIIPTNLLGAAAGTMVTPWGSPMFVGGDPTGNGIVIEMGGMTSALCVGLISQIFGASHDRTLDTASRVGGTALAAWVASANYAAAAFNATVLPTANGAGGMALPAAAGTNCQPNVNTNSAILVFGLQG